MSDMKRQPGGSTAPKFSPSEKEPDEREQIPSGIAAEPALAT